ncbi:MAG: hypothetical protein IJG55_00120 [Synergistaceae bacterium]|nr:hypothetical protein [Synergistaceae bacterium]
MKKLLAVLALVFAFSLLLASVAFAVPPYSRTRIHYIEEYNGLLPKNTLPLKPIVIAPKKEDDDNVPLFFIPSVEGWQEVKAR